MRELFIDSLRKNQAEFGLNPADETVSLLADYYEFVMLRNPLLHLVAPCSAEEFAVRHILESLFLLKFLPENSRFADLGTGAGLPSIPCLIARRELTGVLIESKLKKVSFLKEAVEICGIGQRAEIINRAFEEIPKPDAEFVLCRAIDKFTKKFSKILKWSEGSTKMFFGGHSLRVEIQNAQLKFEEFLMPLSEQRFLFVIKN